MDSRIKRLVKDIFIFAAGNASSKIILLFLMPLYTTKLTTAEYGISDSLNTLIELLVPIITLCMAEAVFRFSIETENRINEIAFFNGSKIMLYGFSIFTAIGLLLKLLFDYEYAFVLVWMLISYSMKQFFGCYLRGIGKSMAFATSGVIGTLVLVISNILLLVSFNQGINGYLWSIVVSNTVSILMMAVTVHPIKIICSNFKSKTHEKKFVLNNMLRYSLPIIPNSISWWLNNAANKYILLFICGSSVTGLFSAAGKVPAVINLLSNIFQQAWQFTSAKEYDKENTSSFYTKIFSLYSPFILLSCSFVIIINPLISNFVLQGDFAEAQHYVPLLLFSSTLSCYSIFFGGIYTAAKKSKMLMISTVVGAFVNIGLCIIMIPIWNVYGALIANVISYSVVVLIRIIDSRKYVMVQHNWVLMVISLTLMLIQSIIGLLDFSGPILVISIVIFGVIAVVNIVYQNNVRNRR